MINHFDFQSIYRFSLFHNISDVSSFIIDRFLYMERQFPVFVSNGILNRDIWQETRDRLCGASWHFFNFSVAVAYRLLYEEMAKKKWKKKKEKEQKRKQRRDDTKCFSHLLSLFSLLTSVCVLSLTVINNYKFLFEYIFLVQRVLWVKYT